MLLEIDVRIRVIGEAADFETAAGIMLEETPDLVLVDLPDFGGRQLLPLLQQIETPVLVLVGQHDFEIYHRCLKLGISGLILKEESRETLFKAIEKIHGGEPWFDRAIMGRTIRQLVSERQMMQDFPKAHVANSLSERETQVVELICKGMKNKDIAMELFITETTVRHHLTSVFNKLEISSRLELVIYAFKNNLVKLPSVNGSHNGNGYVENGKLSALFV